MRLNSESNVILLVCKFQDILHWLQGFIRAKRMHFVCLYASKQLAFSLVFFSICMSWTAHFFT
jgi:hypothetical protein